MVTHSSILAWEIPWTEEPGRLRSIGQQTVSPPKLPQFILCVTLICSVVISGPQEHSARPRTLSRIELHPPLWGSFLPLLFPAPCHLLSALFVPTTSIAVGLSFKYQLQHLPVSTEIKQSLPCPVKQLAYLSVMTGRIVLIAIFIKCFSCARHYAELFLCMISFKTHNSITFRCYSCSYFMSEKASTQKRR